MEQYREEIRRLMLAVNVIDGVYSLSARRLGFKENELSLLYALDDGEPHSQKEICERWLIPKTTLNTIVADSVRAGLVTLDSGPHTHEKTVRLTAAGQARACEALSRVYALEGEAMAGTLRGFSPEFVDAIAAFAGELRRLSGKYIAGADTNERA